jgi:hypothetical protein
MNEILHVITFDTICTSFKLFTPYHAFTLNQRIFFTILRTPIFMGIGNIVSIRYVI